MIGWQHSYVKNLYIVCALLILDLQNYKIMQCCFRGKTLYYLKEKSSKAKGKICFKYKKMTVILELTL
jgi:hypothetical protein